MDQITKKQHYIWRYYLVPWTKDDSTKGQIFCLRNNKIFSASLVNIAHENYFYDVKRMSEQEYELVYRMVIGQTKGIQRKINKQWLDFYCAPFDLADTLVAKSYTHNTKEALNTVEDSAAFKRMRIEHIEKYHAQVESSGIQYLSFLRNNELDFWENAEDREKFSFFIATQYFRTKKTRDSINKVISTINSSAMKSFVSGIHAENIWIPLTLIIASDLGVHISQHYSAIILQAQDSCFIVGDQPVVNTYSTFNMETHPSGIELYYPITPHSALLLTTNQEFKSGQVVEITDEEIKKYNNLELKASNELVFARERGQLSDLIQ